MKEYKYWKKIGVEIQKELISKALAKNINYSQSPVLGLPGTKLDGRVFYEQAEFLKEAPFLQTIVQNPNHIGCHTVGESEPFFQGTQDIEKDVIQILSKDILQSQEDCDGYVTSGGTEANIQACWMYRNFFINTFNANCNEIFLIASQDTHYSVNKAANLLNIDLVIVPVDFDTREILSDQLDKHVYEAVKNGKKYAIVISNAGTTMFGSVDSPDDYASVFIKYDLNFKLHIDAAFGGFIYPIVNQNHNIGFNNKHVSSVTMDAHKMLQAPYGTGIFITRKGLIDNVFTKEAKYVNGMDTTLSGSRSGANAVAIWIILQTYGPHQWLEKMKILNYRTEVCCQELEKLGIGFYRDSHMNIITIKSADLPKTLAVKFGLIPDSHDEDNNWYKIVVMDHVQQEALNDFISELKEFRSRERKVLEN